MAPRGCSCKSFSRIMLRKQGLKGLEVILGLSSKIKTVIGMSGILIPGCNILDLLLQKTMPDRLHNGQAHKLQVSLTHHLSEKRQAGLQWLLSGCSGMRLRRVMTG